jgi:hypothetical protein
MSAFANWLGPGLRARVRLPFGGEERNLGTTRDVLVARLKRAGELIVSGEDQAETGSYSIQFIFDSTARIKEPLP